MISGYGRGLIARRWIRTKLDYACVGFLSLAVAFGNCISVKAAGSDLPTLSADGASRAAQVNKDAVDLEMGKPIERELKAGDVHTYRVTLGLNQFLTVAVNQRNINVAVKLFGPDDTQIADVDTPSVTQGPETVSVVSNAAGGYRLEVRAVEKDAPTGRYEIKIAEIRAATARDGVQIAAERGFSHAEQLRSQGTAKSLREAIQKYEEVLPIFRSTGDRQKEAATLTDIGEVYDLQGENQKARECYDQALPIWRSISDRRGEATTLNNLGVIYNSMGETLKALEYYNQALPILRAIDDKQVEAVTLSNMGGAYRSLGEMRKALECYDQALPIRRSVGDRRGEAITLSNMGLVYALLGEKQKALEYYNQALSIRRSVGDKLGEAFTLNNIGGAYSSLGEMQKALEYYDQALPIWRSTGDRLGEAMTLNNIGGVYDLQGEMLKALEYYNQALPIRRSKGDRRGEATSLNNIGRVYSAMGESQKALEHYNQALPMRRSVGDKLGEAITLNCIGKVYYSLGERQKALDFYTQALLLVRAVGDLNTEALILYGIARVKLNQGDFLQARSNIESALHIIESLRIKVASPELRASYFATVQSYYDFYIDLLMRQHRLEPKQGYDAMALEASERARARTLLEMLIESRADIRQGVDLVLLERERSLQRSLNIKAEQQTRLLNGKHSEQQAEAIKKEIEQLLTKCQEVRSQIRASSPRYAALTQPQPLTLKQIQQEALDSDTLLLEYALGDQHSYLWAVTSDSIASFTLPKLEEVEKAAQRVYDLLTARNRREQGVSPAQRQARIKQAEAEYNRAAAELGQMLLGPVARQLGKKRLLIVADGALNYVPFAALPVPATAQDHQHLLIESHEVTSLPSASSIAVLRKEMAARKPAPKTAAVLADPVFDTDDARVRSSVRGRLFDKANDPSDSLSKRVPHLALMRSANEVGLTDRGNLPRLPFSRQEAEAIYALTRQAGTKQAATRVALDFEASRETASSPDLGQYRIVHFATHGLLNNEHPELSGIVLSLVDRQGEPQNGFFRLYDVYNMNLNAELVVLSACQTALGKQIRGEGLIGLTRGFMYAGAARVMASLWRVEDEATSEMMKKFYEGMIREGQRPAAALRSAQVWMQRQKRWRTPYYWAGFILQGEWK